MSRFVTPDYLEKFHVRDVYDKIAPHFAGSRHKAWPKVEAFLRSLPSGSVVVDVGCGTGKYLSVTLDSVVIGSDSCMTFAEIAKTKGHSVVACDNQSLPFKDGCCDAVISIGVVHHFASAKRRIKALQELFRILRPGGKMLVYVWALEQNERKFDGQDVLVPYTHHPRNRGRKRSQSIPSIPRRKSMIEVRDSFSLGSTPPWRSRRTFSCDESLTAPERPGKERLTMHSGNELLREHSGKDFISKDSVSSSSAVQLRQHGEKYSVIKDLKSGKICSSSEQEQDLEQTAVSKLRQFFTNVLEKFFPSEENGARCREEAHADKVSGDGVTDFHTKVSTLVSYFSSENRDKYLSLLPKRFLSNKEELSLSDAIATQDTPHYSETNQEFPSAGNVTSMWERNSHQNGGVVVFKAQRRCVQPFAPHEETKSNMNGIGLSVVARLVESLASSSDIDSDSSTSSDCVTSDSSAVDDWDPIGIALVAHSNRTFRHTAVECREDLGAEPPTSSEESLSSSSTSLSSSSSSSLSSSSASSSGSLPHTKVKSKLFQRYYHVFCAGELAQLVREGIPSASVLNEYYDHGNWAVVVVKGQR